MKVISIVSSKGGVGKSTTALSIAAFLANKGKSVCLIDIDPQLSCKTWAEITNDLSFAVGSKDDLDIKELSKSYEFCVVDTPPRLDADIVEIVDKISDYIVVLLRTSGFDLWSLTVSDAPFKKDKRTSVLLTQTHKRFVLDGMAKLQLAGSGYKVLKSRMVQRMIYQRAVSMGKTIFDIRGGESRAAQLDIQNIIKEMEVI